MGTIAAVLHLHVAPRPELLVDRLAEVLRQAPADPFEPEWIAVPSEGMRRWLHLELAARLGASPGGTDGVVANVVRAFPSQLRTEVLDAAAPDPVDGGGDPWRVDRLVWPVLAELAGSVDGPLREVAEVPPGGSRYARARRVADLFDRYHLHRTDMVLDWADGRDLDGTGRSLPDAQRWQPQLWRRVRDRIGVPSPPERLPAVLAALTDPEAPLQVPSLPGRLVLFGLSVLPSGAGFLDLVDAVGATREVHVLLVEPSPAASARVAAEVEPRPGRARTRAEDRTVEAVEHPLLRSWGRLHREAAVLLADAAAEGVGRPDRLADPPAEEARTLLGRLQQDLRSDRAPEGTFVPDPDDTTIRVHAAYGSTRQVEVLRDLLLHLLDDDRLAVDEDDILVVCPDLATMAPIIAAVLGPSTEQLDPGEGAPGIRYRLTDRSLRGVVPLLDALERLLGLLDGRFDAPSVLDLVAAAPVRRRFSLTEDDVGQLTDWVVGTRIRWGLDEQHRSGAGVPEAFDTNCWRAGLDRLLSGLCVHDERHLCVGAIAPYPVPGGDTGLVGRLAELLARLDVLHRRARDARPLPEWVAFLRLAAGLLLAVDRDDRWQQDVLDGLLADLAEVAEQRSDAASVPLGFGDLRRIVSERAAGSPGRSDFFRGGVTISSMTPLRGVPFRVVVLLGADQHAFTTSPPDGDDLVAAAPLLGDPDLRGESRLALLETVLAARDRLVFIREGADVRTNQEVPRAVPVAELLDVVAATIHPDHRRRTLDRLEVHHPRQATDEAAFVPGALVDGRPWSHDPAALRGALAARTRPRSAPAFLERPLEAPEEPRVALADLHDFLRDPTGHFLRRRLGVVPPRDEDAPAPLLPLDLKGLAKWDVGSRLLAWRLAGGDADEWEHRERRLGTLGPGSLAEAALAEARATVDLLLAAADRRGVRRGDADAVPVEVTLPDGTVVAGSVEDRLEGDPGPARVGISSYKPVHLLASWLDLMALVASDPTRPWRAVGVHKERSSRNVVVLELRPSAGPPAADRLAAATNALAVAVDCYRRGSVEPIPLFPDVGRAVQTGRPATDAWRSGGGGGEGTEAPVHLVWGHVDLRRLQAVPSRDGDPAHERHRSRLACFSHHLWDAVEASVEGTVPERLRPRDLAAPSGPGTSGGGAAR